MEALTHYILDPDAGELPPMFAGVEYMANLLRSRNVIFIRQNGMRTLSYDEKS